MDSDRRRILMSLFSQCVEIPESRQEVFIDSACGADEQLRAELCRMLDHDRGLTDKVAIAASIRSVVDIAIVDTHEHDQLPQMIGKYRVIRELGRGGMGIVYEAEQEQPKRRVALKVVPRLASSESRQRLMQEAQALGMIEDPGVARVYESGVADVFGLRTPFIAMELVEGEQINAWVQSNALSLNERIQLIARVADAVQTAHSRGVIHRDLKPGNIKVVHEHRGPGQPKVLDFGIARLITSDLNAQGLTSPESGPMGTLQYMSPEQFNADRSAIDARSDIYSLGAVAYTLLGGVEPIDMSRATLASAARMVSEQDPKPLGALNRSLRGDIEIVIAKAMSREIGRRYQTMEAFAADLRRILTHQPIVARPPSLPYLLARFVQRNTVISASAAMIALLFIVSFFWIDQARGRAIAESQTSAAVGGFLVDMLRSIEPNTSLGKEVTVREVLDDATRRLEEGELADQPETNARLRLVIAQVYQSLGHYEQAIDQTRIARDQLVALHGRRDILVEQSIEQLAQIETLDGLYEDAEQHFLEASALLEQLGMEPIIISEDGSLGIVYYWTGRYDESEQFFRDAIDYLRDVDPSQDARLGHSLSSLGSVLESQGEIEQAIEYHHRGLEAQIAFYGPGHTKVAEAYNDLGNTLVAAGRYEDAIEAHKHALEIRRQRLDPRHPDMAVSLNNLAVAYIRMGDPNRAIPMLQNVLDIRLEIFGENHPATCSSMGNLARAYMEAGKLNLALPAFDRAVEAAQATVGEDHIMSVVFRANRGDCLRRMGRFDEAESILLSEFARIDSMLGPSHFRTKGIAAQVLQLYSDMGRTDELARWEERAKPE